MLTRSTVSRTHQEMASTRMQIESPPAMHQILSISKARQSKISLEPNGIIIQDKIHVPEKLGPHVSCHVTMVVDPETLNMQRYIIPVLPAYEIKNVTLNPMLTRLALIYKRPQESRERINIHYLTSTVAHSAEIAFYPRDPVLYSAWINESVLAVVTLKSIYHYDVNKEISSCLSDSYQYFSNEKYKVLNVTGLDINAVLNYEVSFNGQYALLKVKEGSSEEHVYYLISLELCLVQKLDNIRECKFEHVSGDRLWIAAISHGNSMNPQFYSTAVDRFPISFKLGKTLRFSHVLKDGCQIALAKTTSTLETQYYISLEDTSAIYQFSSNCKISQIADVGVSDLQVNPLSGCLTGLQVNPDTFCVMSNHITECPQQVPSQPRHIPMFDYNCDAEMLELMEMFYSHANMSGHISVLGEQVPVNCLSRELFLCVDDNRSLNLGKKTRLVDLNFHVQDLRRQPDLKKYVPKNANLVMTSNTMKNVRRLMLANILNHPVVIEGSTAGGKTASVMYCAYRAHAPLLRLNLTPQTSTADFLGSLEFEEDNNLQSDKEVSTINKDINMKLVFRPGIFTRAVSEGFWLVLDEANIAGDSILRVIEDVLNSGLLEIRGSMLAGQSQALDGSIKYRQHPNFRIFMTQNPPDDREYGESRNIFSVSLLSHFIPVVFQAIPMYPDCRDIVTSILGGKTHLANCILGIYEEIQNVRSRTSVQLTFRDLLQACDIINDSKPSDKAIHIYFLFSQHASQKDKQLVHDLVQARFGSIKWRNFLPVQYPPKYAPLERHTAVFKFLDMCKETKRPGLLVGETYSGKFTSVEIWAKLRRLETEVYYTNPETSAEDLFGKIQPQLLTFNMKYEKIPELEQLRKEIGSYKA